MSGCPVSVKESGVRPVHGPASPDSKESDRQRRSRARRKRGRILLGVEIDEHAFGRGRDVSSDELAAEFNKESGKPRKQLRQ